MPATGKEPAILDERAALGPGERTGRGFEGVRCPSCGAHYAVSLLSWDASWRCICGAQFSSDALECPGAELGTIPGARHGTVLIHTTAGAAAAPFPKEAESAPEREPPATLERARREIGSAFDGKPMTITGDEGAGHVAPGSEAMAFGNYEIVREIARGGMGVVYLARQMGLGREVALKMLLSGDAAGGEQVKRFMREAESAARLSHPNIVPIYDVGFTDGRHYYAMEFIKGKSLAEDLAEGGRMPPKKALRIALDSALALGYAHENGIVHRDVKPGNIMLEQGFDENVRHGKKSASDATMAGKGRVLLTDFGLAKETSGENALTVSGTTLGTPAYMSPEQADGDVRNVGPASDVYSLGAVLYEMVTGREPFSANSVGQLLFAVIAQDPVPPRKIVPELHRDVETIILKAMSKSPRKRYENASAMAEDIARFLSGEAISARPSGPAARAFKIALRHKAATLSTAAVAVLLAAAVAATWLDAVGRRRRVESALLSRIALGHAAFAAGEHAQAERAFEEALAISPRLAAVLDSVTSVRLSRHLQQARALLYAKDYENAALVLDQARRTAPDHTEVSRLLRIQKGTATLAVEADFPGASAWFVPFVSGVRIDGLPAALAGGLVSAGVETLGALPYGPSDRPFSDGWVIVSSAGEHRARFVSMGRNQDVRLSFATLVVGKGGRFGTISEAIEAAPPGAEIVVEQGEYRENIEVRKNSMVLRAAVPGSVTISGSGDAPAVTARDCGGFRLEGFKVVSSGKAGVLLQNCRGALLSGNTMLCPSGSPLVALGCGELWVTANEISGGAGVGVQCEDSDNVVFAGNLVNGNGEAGIFFRNGKVLLSLNALRENRGFGAYIKQTTVANVIDNMVQANPLGGISVTEAAGSIIVTGNFVSGADSPSRSGNPSVAIFVGYSPGTGTVSRNTAIMSSVGIRALMSGQIDYTDNILAGNGVGIWTQSGGRLDFNCHFKNKYFGQWSEKVAYSIDEMRSHYNPNNEPRMPRSFEADPMFSDAPAGDFSIRDGSPCKGAASDGGDIGARFEVLAPLPGREFDNRAWTAAHAVVRLRAEASAAFRGNRLDDALTACSLGLNLSPGDAVLSGIENEARAAKARAESKKTAVK